MEQSHNADADNASAVLNFQSLFASQLCCASGYGDGLTEAEVDWIASADVGECLFIVDKDVRMPLKIELFFGEEKYIERPSAIV